MVISRVLIDTEVPRNFPFVACEGAAPNVPGSAAIFQISLQTQSLTNQFPAQIMFWNPQLNTPKHVTADHDGRVFYNCGFVGSFIYSATPVAPVAVD